MVVGLKIACAAVSLSAALSFALYALSFEPYGVAELAYIFAVPAVLACKLVFAENGEYQNARRKARAAANSQSRDFYIQILKKYAPVKRAYFAASFIGGWLAWIWLLVWLRHVYPPSGWFAAVLLPLVIDVLFMFPWFALLVYMLPSSRQGAPSRLFSYASLAGLWVGLEWIRSWIFTGFPWLLLANSQWLRPAVIQSASWGGVWIVSFTLIFFNLAIAEYICRLFLRERAKFKGESRSAISRLTPEFYIALALLLSGVWTYIANLPRPENQQKLFRAGIVQNDYAGILKWSKDLASENMGTLRKLSGALTLADVDVILWPEAATPPCYPLNFTAMRGWVEDLSKSLKTPLLIGSMTYDSSQNAAQNGAFFISPELGLSKDSYAKQHLVPFGEYVPRIFWFLGKVVPVGNLKRGESSRPMPVKIAGSDYKVGSMICYEDVFPQLGRAAALEGADMLFVCTNDSWYGREAGAWQHASHSALQAVATRKIILRSSNNGLSAVFDQYGRMMPSTTIENAQGQTWNGSNAEAQKPVEIRDEYSAMLDPKTLKPKKGSPLVNDEGSIYFRGCGYVDVKSYKNFDGKTSAYVRYGDWVAYVSLALGLAGLLGLARKKA